MSATLPMLLERTTCATLIAFGGGALGLMPARFAARHLPLMVYTAMGVLLGVTVFDALPDAKALLSWPQFLGAVASGGGLFWLVGRFVAPLCPACALGALDVDAARRLGRSTVLLMVAMSLHSTMDGVAVVAGDAVTGRPDPMLLLAVSLHKLPEGLALSLLLLGAGYTRRTALLWTLAIESTTELGGLLAVFGLHHLSPVGLGLVFGNVGGGFLYLAANVLGAFGGHRPRQGRPAWAGPPAISGGVAFGLTAALLQVAARYAR